MFKITKMETSDLARKVISLPLGLSSQHVLQRMSSYGEIMSRPLLPGLRR